MGAGLRLHGLMPGWGLHPPRLCSCAALLKQKCCCGCELLPGSHCAVPSWDAQSTAKLLQSTESDLTALCVHPVIPERFQ